MSPCLKAISGLTSTTSVITELPYTQIYCITGSLCLLRLDRDGVPGHNSLALSAHGGLEAAGGSPGVEPAVINVPQVHAHQPEAQSRVLDGCELEFHLEIDSDQHLCHIS